MANKDNQRMPNGKPKGKLPKPPKRWDDPIFENVFPDTNIGRLLHGLSIQFLIKQEHRMGWPYRGACGEVSTLLDHPNESVAAHMWGVAQILATVSKDDQFKLEMPNFDLSVALQMAIIHDVPELVTTDITPEDPVSKDQKAEDERNALDKILSYHPKGVADSLHEIYKKYEERLSTESRFVKDCDRLDFMIYAFVLERQGFDCIEEFYTNTINDGKIFTNIAQDMADQLCKTRNNLRDEGRLYVPKP